MIDANDREILLDKEKLAEEKKQVEKEFSDHQKYLEDWRIVLGTPSGRRIVWDLLGAMGFQRDLFSSDALMMAMNCGQHRLSLSLAKDIEEAVPGVYARMTNEFRSLQANKDK